MSRILIVEDELAIAEALQLALAKAGHESEVLAFGVTVASKLKLDPGRFQMVILDVGLPDISGFEVCKQIRSVFSAQQLPVLFLTAQNDEIDRILGLELSGGDYLSKPFSLRELVTRVRLLLERSALAKPALTLIQNYGQFSWSQDEAWVRYDKQALALTLSEMRLLTQLLSRPRQVFSRQQLLDVARGDTSPSSDRTIDTHIKTLRIKLKQVHPEADIVVTHRGLGYSCA